MPNPQQETTASTSRSLPWWVRLCRWLWKLTAFLAVAVLLALLVNVTSTWLTSSKGIIPADSPWGIMMTHWHTTLLVALCLLLAAAFLWAVSRWYTQVTQQPLPTAQDRVRMLRRLRFRYEQMLSQSLQGAVQIELGLVSRPSAVQQSASLALRLPEQTDQPLPPHTSVVEAYELSEQELLILGEPGAGKSTLLLELAHYLIGQAEKDEGHPLSVLVPLSSWAVKRPSLQDWLIEQVASLYAVPKRLSREWVQAQQILPLLDGLDEMDEAARPACIEAINAYKRSHLGPLVVCSRTNEYYMVTKRERLALHTAVIVQPLSYAQVNAHLATLGKPLSGLRSALKKQSHLQAMATTPLMLQVLMLTYHGTSIRELPQKEEQLREQIWTDYIQKMVERKGDARCYPLHVTIVWLRWLASQMRSRNQTVFFLEQIQPEWLSKRPRILYRLSTTLLFGLLFGSLFGLTFGQFAGQFTGQFYSQFYNQFYRQFVEQFHLQYVGLIGGLIYGLLFGLLGGQFYGFSVLLQVKKVPDRNLSAKARKDAEKIPNPNPFYLELYSGMQFTESLVLSPNEGTRRSLKSGLLLFVLGLLAWLLFGLLLGQFIGLPPGLLFGLVTGLLFGLVAGLLFGLQAVLQHYTLRIFLARSGVFPWKAVPFLEDATARILLRRVGGGYSFTHRMLLDHFADMETKTAPDAKTLPAATVKDV